ncbi:MAG: hypothetical protein WB609_10740 [Candidatus Cybelea sp.]
MLLGAAVAGCSTNSSAPSGNTQLGASLTANVRRSQLLSEGFGQVSSHRTRPSGWVAPDVNRRKALIYWGDYYNNTITIYPAKGTNPPEKGQITSGLSNPERLFVDNAFAVYATNIGNNTITEYKRHATTPGLTISTGIDTPTGLTVDAAGTVYCANTGSESITVYPKGHTSPSLTIPIAGSPEYLAIDRSDNLYVSYLGGSKRTGVVEFAPGSTTGNDLGLDVSGAGALAVDRSGNIVIVNEYGSTIDVFRAGQTEPSKRIGVTAGTAFGLSLSKKETKLYVSVETGGEFVVQQLDYPHGKSLTTKLSTNAGN